MIGWRGTVTRVIVLGTVASCGLPVASFAADLTPVWISDDGAKAIFRTDGSMAPTDSDTDSEGFPGPDLYERSGGETTQISTNTEGTANNTRSHVCFIGASADGSRVFFATTESLAPTDNEELGESLEADSDIYLRSGGTTTQISTNADGTANARVPNGHALDGSASCAGGSRPDYQVIGDGAGLIWRTNESLVSTDQDGGSADIYEWYDGAIEQVSTNAAGTANDTGKATHFAGSSPDGTAVFFATQESLVPSDTDDEMNLYERSDEVVKMITNGDPAYPDPRVAELGWISPDGSRLIFDSGQRLASTDTDGGAGDVYEWSDGVVDQISISATADPQAPTSQSRARFQDILGDGSAVLFEACPRMTANDNDTNCARGDTGLDLYERSAAGTSLVSTNTAGTAAADSDVQYAGSSTDGTHVYFITDESLSSADRDHRRGGPVGPVGDYDIYDRSDGKTELVSTNTAGDANETTAGVPPQLMAASADGSRVYFGSSLSLASTDADHGNDRGFLNPGGYDIFERSNGLTTQVSTNSAGDANDPNAFASFSFGERIPGQRRFSALGASPDGSRVMFTTNERLAPTDTDDDMDLYTRIDNSLSQFSKTPPKYRLRTIQISMSSHAPLFGRTVKLSYAKRSHRFAGSIRVLGPRDCRFERRLTIYRRRAGRDPKVTKVTTRKTGAFSKKRRVAPGRYYALARYEVLADARCRMAKSATVNVRR